MYVITNVDEIFVASNEVLRYIEKCKANIECPFDILLAKSRSKTSNKDELGSDNSLADDALEIAEMYATINMKRRKKSIIDAEEGLTLKRSKSMDEDLQDSQDSSRLTVAPESHVD